MSRECFNVFNQVPGSVSGFVPELPEPSLACDLRNMGWRPGVSDIALQSFSAHLTKLDSDNCGNTAEKTPAAKSNQGFRRGIIEDAEFNVTTEQFRKRAKIVYDPKTDIIPS